MKKRVLIVEDEKNIVDILSFNLVREGYETLEAYDGETGLQLALEQNPDLILLDLMLPKRSGFDVCKAFRGTEPERAGSDAHREGRGDRQGAGAGAGGRRLYHQAFFHAGAAGPGEGQYPPHRGASARGGPGAAHEWGANQIVQGRIRIDTEEMVGYKDNVPLDLTQREYELLKFLASQPGKVFSREALMEHVWNYEGYVGDVRAVDVAVRRLREKVEDDPASPQFILTRRGLGYLFHGEAQ